MAEFLLAALRLILEFALYATLYATGRLILPLISLGRIKVAPLREPIGRARELATRATGDIVAGEGWCTFVGFVFWAAVILLLAHFARAP
ncbi:hypothetical protein SSBR45G_51350 [Bradyrhizobium sp. SSBR45G]|uniref:hypothetical protein n=1 Tax=unclassified Bradyrhizobium TaxID=2631580 RepID=UPI002342A566|nr:MULTISPECIES: hypothetical protein [unclassified Bradyrhizobium]GLH80226.1 hypothetical protein SSBR45G_51350 [Bradyrhizobium sp. SSBR45G]GLH87720.1 hypothetical protein SSBR45R_51800 [Bradyrhizobium sp. SSBR45R]